MSDVPLTVAPTPLPSYDLAALSRDLAQDPQAVRDNIINTPVEISGILIQYGQNPDSSSYLVLASREDPVVPAMRCEFSPAYAHLAASQTVGQPIVLGATWRGDMRDHIPSFAHCTLRN